MIQMQTNLDVADNSGARRVMTDADRLTLQLSTGGDVVIKLRPDLAPGHAAAQGRRQGQRLRREPSPGERGKRHQKQRAGREGQVALNHVERNSKRRRQYEADTVR